MMSKDLEGRDSLQKDFLGLPGFPLRDLETEINLWIQSFSRWGIQGCSVFGSSTEQGIEIRITYQCPPQTAPIKVAVPNLRARLLCRESEAEIDRLIEDAKKRGVFIVSYAFLGFRSEQEPAVAVCLYYTQIRQVPLGLNPSLFSERVQLWTENLLDPAEPIDVILAYDSSRGVVMNVAMSPFSPPRWDTTKRSAPQIQGLPVRWVSEVWIGPPEVVAIAIAPSVAPIHLKQIPSNVMELPPALWADSSQPISVGVLLHTEEALDPQATKFRLDY